MASTKILQFLLAQGVIPLCSGGASFCFALYSAKVAHAADLWESSLAGDDDIQAYKVGRTWSTSDKISLVQHQYNESVSHYVIQLRRHSGTSCCLSLTTAAMAVEAYRDWNFYATPAHATWEDLCLALWKRQQPLPFFLRRSVVLTSAGALAMSLHLYKGLVLWQPEPPMYYT